MQIGLVAARAWCADREVQAGRSGPPDGAWRCTSAWGRLMGTDLTDRRPRTGAAARPRRGRPRDLDASTGAPGLLREANVAFVRSYARVAWSRWAPELRVRQGIENWTARLSPRSTPYSRSAAPQACWPQGTSGGAFARCRPRGKRRSTGAFGGRRSGRFIDALQNGAGGRHAVRRCSSLSYRPTIRPLRLRRGRCDHRRPALRDALEIELEMRVSARLW